MFLDLSGWGRTHVEQVGVVMKVFLKGEEVTKSFPLIYMVLLSLWFKGCFYNMTDLWRVYLGLCSVLCFFTKITSLLRTQTCRQALQTGSDLYRVLSVWRTVPFVKGNLAHGRTCPGQTWVQIWFEIFQLLSALALAWLESDFSIVFIATGKLNQAQLYSVEPRSCFNHTQGLSLKIFFRTWRIAQVIDPFLPCQHHDIGTTKRYETAECRISCLFPSIRLLPFSPGVCVMSELNPNTQ